MTNTFQHKYPLQPYVGKFIKGHGEVDENGSLNFIISVTMCAPKSAAKRFRHSITRYHQHIIQNVFSENLLKDKLHPYLSQAKMKGYLYEKMTWKNDEGFKSIRQFEKIVEGVGMTFSFDIQSKYVQRYVPLSSHNDFILYMLKSLDVMIESVQQNSDNMVMFVPIYLSRVRSERKITMLNLQSQTIY